MDYGKVVTTRESDHLVRLTDVTTGRELTTLTKTVGGIHQSSGRRPNALALGGMPAPMFFLDIIAKM